MKRTNRLLLPLMILLLPATARGVERDVIYSLPAITVVASGQGETPADPGNYQPAFTLVVGPEKGHWRSTALPPQKPFPPPLITAPPLTTVSLPDRSRQGLTAIPRAVPLFTTFPALLTFDDGPNPKVTPELIRYLKKAGLTDTIFFFVGERMSAFPHLVRMVARAGFPIGYHSMNHRNMINWPAWRIRQDIRQFKKVLNDILGYPYPLVWGRPPYGGLVTGRRRIPSNGGFHSNRLVNRVAESIHAAFEAENLLVMLWDVDTEDWKRPLESRLISRRFLPGRRQIWLFHEYRKTDILRKLPELLWRFQEMIAERARRAVAG